MYFDSVDIPLNYDDRMCVGPQSKSDLELMAWWCHECCTHTDWTWLWFLGKRIKLPICWWCGGPQVSGKPTRTVQRVDQTIQNTNLEPVQHVGNDWGFDPEDYVIPFANV